VAVPLPVAVSPIYFEIVSPGLMNLQKDGLPVVRIAADRFSIRAPVFPQESFSGERRWEGLLRWFPAFNGTHHPADVPAIWCSLL